MRDVTDEFLLALAGIAATLVGTFVVAVCHRLHQHRDGHHVGFRRRGGPGACAGAGGTVATRRDPAAVTAVTVVTGSGRWVLPAPEARGALAGTRDAPPGPHPQ